MLCLGFLQYISQIYYPDYEIPLWTVPSNTERDHLNVKLVMVVKTAYLLNASQSMLCSWSAFYNK